MPQVIPPENDTPNQPDFENDRPAECPPPHPPITANKQSAP